MKADYQIFENLSKLFKWSHLVEHALNFSFFFEVGTANGLLIVLTFSIEGRTDTAHPAGFFKATLKNGNSHLDIFSKLHLWIGGGGREIEREDPPSKIFAKLVNRNAIKPQKGLPFLSQNLSKT